MSSGNVCLLVRKELAYFQELVFSQLKNYKLGIEESYVFRYDRPLTAY